MGDGNLPKMLPLLLVNIIWQGDVGMEEFICFLYSVFSSCGMRPYYFVWNWLSCYFWEWIAKNLLTDVWVIELVNDGCLPWCTICIDQISNSVGMVKDMSWGIWFGLIPKGVIDGDGGSISYSPFALSESGVIRAYDRFPNPRWVGFRFMSVDIFIGAIFGFEGFG
jgi:hypothetical protein